MGADSKIQWTHHTFNPWIGCAKVSPGCKHCYAEVQTYPRVSKARGRPLWGEGSHRHVTSATTWRAPIHWNREAHIDRARRRVFCASLADVFEDRDDLRVHRARLAEIIRATPHLDWLLLTKRPENAARLWAGAWADSWNGADSLGFEWPANIWLGTTVEDQTRADERIPHLLRVPARVRFLSCEPLLERVTIAGFLGRGVQWVIAGGESGTRARPCALEWIEYLIAQCRAANVPAFVKQLGALVVSEERALDESQNPAEYGLPSRWAWAAELKDRAGGDPEEWPEELRVMEFPRLEAA